MCEYRFFLDQKAGRQKSKASITGEFLHSVIAQKQQIQEHKSKSVPLIIIILTIILGLLWILW